MKGILWFIVSHPAETFIFLLLVALAVMVRLYRREQAKGAADERNRQIQQAQGNETKRRQENEQARTEMKDLDAQAQDAKRDGAAARDRQAKPHQRVKERFDKYNRDK